MTQDSELKKVLIKKYHLLCRRLGLDENAREAMLEQYGVASSKDLSTKQLSSLCLTLSSPDKSNKAQQLRKIVIGAIISFLDQEREGFKEWDSRRKIEYAKNTALNAAGMPHDSFNQIPETKLRNIASMFNKMKNKKKQ